MRNSSRKSTDKRRESRARKSRSSRRGVLLLVVLSMLVLFMLVGTAFLMSSNQSRIQMKEAAKQDRLGNYATKLLERAMFQILRDTDNKASVIRYHSLLRDLYGTDGFQAVVYVPADLPTEAGFLTRYAGATTGSYTEQVGPTAGQFVDIYVSQKSYGSTTDYSTLYTPNSAAAVATNLGDRNVLKLEPNPYGQPQPYPLPVTKGYFNGCLLTMTSGPATGQSARILDYECIVNPTPTSSTTTVQRLFRFRVMAFPRADGQQLKIDPDTAAKGRCPELADLAGQTFIVNGRAFSGTGVGYNPLAQAGQPRLNAVQLFPLQTAGGGLQFVSEANPANNPTNRFAGAELALLPNSVYFNPLNAYIGVGTLPSAPDPFGWYALSQFQLLNSPYAKSPINPAFGYPTFAGFGGANEGYDAADFQNMFLALQTVTPRPQGRVLHRNGTDLFNPLILEANDPNVINKPTDFLRFDIEDVPIPSFHRPDLANFWNHRLVSYFEGEPCKMDADDAVRAVVQPYIDDKWTINPNAAGLTPEMAALISAVRRQVSLRPIREDHPHFDGSNPDSLPIPAANLAGKDGLFVPDDPSIPANRKSIAVPTWDVIGRWDVDNDNDGVRDSIWVDLGDPIQITEDGRRYKPLYAFLCIDLDSRLNVNAHGSIADSSLPYQRSSNLDPPLAGIIETPPGSGTYTAVRGAIETGLVIQTTGTPYTPQPRNNFTPGPNLAGSTPAGSTYLASPVTINSQMLPRGIGYGTAEISLRPIFPVPWSNNLGGLDLRGNRSEVVGGPVDSYKSLLVGRERIGSIGVSGRYGYEPQVLPNGRPRDAVTPGLNYQYTPDIPAAPTMDRRQPDLATQMKFFGYPWRRDTYSTFGAQPDLFGRYSLGLDYTGQPFDDMAYDRNPNDANPSNINLSPRIHASLLTDVPYELDLSRSQRRDSWASNLNSTTTPANAFDTSLDHYAPDTNLAPGINDDSPYSATDLEKVLRGWDPDHGTLPSRLWDVVNDFDPLKLRDWDPNRVQFVATNAFGSTSSSAVLAAAQQIAGINRRLVTTDSYDLPVANETMPGYVSEFGPDGLPGRRNDPDLPNRLILNYPISDDFQVIMAGRDGVPVTQGVTRSQAKIPDLLYYRVWIEARKYVMRAQSLTEMGAANSVDSLNPADYQTFLALVTQRARLVFFGKTVVPTQAIQSKMQQLPSELLAPEILAGQRMDLNRPFGDGKDNRNPFTLQFDGVVDDPMESGEPFLDVNGNGQRDGNEPFIDLNANKQYDGPTDDLWTGLTGEQVAFDYTNGFGQLLHPLVDEVIKNSSIGQYVLGGIRNLESQGRQLYARHLYCLMLLLTDENYIAPWDESDPQILTYIENERNKLINTNLSPPLTVAEADLIVKRKLTCRMIAQWAVNCVDMRDSDAIMTPFEYDENPWDGWGVWDDRWIGEDSNASFVKVKRDTSKPAPTFIPLDGDTATDENDGWVLDWINLLPPVGPRFDQAPYNFAIPKTRKQIGADFTKAVDISGTPPTNPPAITHPLNKTRGVVWGAERPDLLITETVAFHDRRTEDATGATTGSSEIMHKQVKDTENPDPDLDQGLRPRGSLFVEVYNPWSPDAQQPAELYSKIDSSVLVTDPKRLTISSGIELGRLSNLAWDGDFEVTQTITSTGKLTVDPTDPTKDITRSPVWRIIEVEEWPVARDVEFADKNGAMDTNGYLKKPTALEPNHGDIELLNNSPFVVNKKPPTAYQEASKRFMDWFTGKWTVNSQTTEEPPRPRLSDPDFDPLFDSSFVPKQSLVPPAVRYARHKFQMQYPYIEREFYFTTDKSALVMSPWDAAERDLSPKFKTLPSNFKLRIPYRKIDFKNTANDISTVWPQKFIPNELEMDPNPAAGIAPILPGRYGVIGSAGTRYSDDAKANNKQKYTTTIGRVDAGIQTGSASDTTHLTNLRRTRRIELWPQLSPDFQQLRVASNGGNPKGEVLLAGSYDPYSKEIFRDNELIFEQSSGLVKNIQDAKPNNDSALTGEPNNLYYQPCVSIPVEGMNISEPAWGWRPREEEAAREEFYRQDAYKKKNPTKTGTAQAPKYEFAPGGPSGEGRYASADKKDTQPKFYDVPLDTAPETMRTGTTANYRTIHLQRLANPMLPWNPYPTLADGKTANPDYRPNLPINPYRTIDSSSANLTAFNGVSRQEGALPTQRDEGKYRPWEGTEKGGYEGLMFSNADKNSIAAKIHQVWYFRSLERGAWSRFNLFGSNPPTPGEAISTLPQRDLWSQEPANVFLQKSWEKKEIYDLIANRTTTTRFNESPDRPGEPRSQHYANMILEHSLGFGNKSYGLLYDTQGAKKVVPPSASDPFGSKTTSAAPSPALTNVVAGSPAPSRILFRHEVDPATGNIKATSTEPPVYESTYPWFAWDNRPYVSSEELLKVPAASQSTMLRNYSTVDPNAVTSNRRDPYGVPLATPPADPTKAPANVGSRAIPAINAVRFNAIAAPFGQLANVFATWDLPADVIRDATGTPVMVGAAAPNPGSIQPYGAPNFSRILGYVQVPSRFVGTDTVLNAETFNNDRNIASAQGLDDLVTAQASPLTGSTIFDPRYFFQPPFNKVSRERDPGRVNLNTVTGRRIAPTSTTPAQIWSEVYDGIMHRYKDPKTGVGDNNLIDYSMGPPVTVQLGHFGPAWRDVVLSRRGYVQIDAAGMLIDKPSAAAAPDTLQSGLNNNFPTMFANPFRSPDAGDLVPVAQMMQYGVDASLERVHPRNRGPKLDSNGIPILDTNPGTVGYAVDNDSIWGQPGVTPFGDARDAGFGNDGISRRTIGTIPGTAATVYPVPRDPAHPLVFPNRDAIPLFSEARNQAFADTNRNPYMMYEPMSRLGNLVTNRSGVYAVWITVGYFEVEKAPDWNDPDSSQGGLRDRIRKHFGGSLNDGDDATKAAFTIYNRVYPDGYMLGKELGSETGDIRRPRGFYIIDRTEEVGFKPGEDLNVEKTIRLRRRIE